MIPINTKNDKRSPRWSKYQSTLVLQRDNWDDRGYKTSFFLYYYDQKGRREMIGTVKIYYYGNDRRRSSGYRETHTIDMLDQSIVQLSPEFCSLGENLEYYINLKRLCPLDYKDILIRLNDIAVNTEIRKKFIDEDGVKTSLLRFSSAEKAMNEAAEVLEKNSTEAKDITFSYQIQLPYDMETVMLHFDFAPAEFLPYRINILIGKNGTGKTQILSHLANSLSGYTDAEENCFIGKRPPVDKVMSVSYSAFDQFRKPPENERAVYSYVYCGIQNKAGTLSLQQLKQNLIRSYNIVKNKERLQVWEEVLSELMEPEHNRIIQQIKKEKFDSIQLSSGQHILISTMTEIIAKIENESIILFDEPEIHLHPNAVANVMRMFYSMLEKFNSYAIFSTHSPLILQEIPSRYIQILNRIDNILFVRKPGVECFGNNISNIVYDVFEVRDEESNYKTFLKKLSTELPVDKIEELFQGKLSLNARIYLKNCFDKDTV